MSSLDHSRRSLRMINYISKFKPGRKYHFTKWHEDEDLEISITDGIITCNGVDYKSMDEFKKSIGIENMNPVDFSKMMIDEFTKSGNKLSDARFNYLLYLKGGDIEQLKDNIKKSGYSLNEIGKGYEIVKESFRLITKYDVFLERYTLKKKDI